MGIISRLGPLQAWTMLQGWLYERPDKALQPNLAISVAAAAIFHREQVFMIGQVEARTARPLFE